MHRGSGRKATVQQVQTTAQAQTGTGRQTLSLTYADSGVGGTPVPRPHLGGLASGFHSAPQIGDQVLVLTEAGDYPIGSVSVTDSPSSLPNLNPGESLIVHPSGAYIKLSDTGAVLTLYVNANLQMQFDGATNRCNLTAAGGLWVGGVQVTVP